LKLESNEIHIWFIFPEGIKNRILLEGYQKLLSSDEKVRKKKFRFPEHQHRFLVTRAAARTVLSLYEDFGPQQWRFFINEHGRPEIEASMNPRGIRFNISHTPGIIAIGVVLKNDIGVDVENINRKSDVSKIANRFFSPREISDLNSVPESRRRERFFQYWTLKESYIKARGIGLSLPLGQFAFHLKDKEPIKASFDSRLGDDPSGWQFFLFEPVPGYPTALSVKRPPGLRYRIYTGRTIPLVLREQFSCKEILSSG
jgi:4'-phosphopantetheinyl transferase